MILFVHNYNENLNSHVLHICDYPSDFCSEKIPFRILVLFMS